MYYYTRYTIIFIAVNPVQFSKPKQHGMTSKWKYSVNKSIDAIPSPNNITSISIWSMYNAARHLTVKIIAEVESGEWVYAWLNHP